MANKWVSAWLREIGRKGGKSTAEKRRGDSEYYRALANKRWKKKKKEVNNE